MSSWFYSVLRVALCLHCFIVSLYRVPLCLHGFMKSLEYLFILMVVQCLLVICEFSWFYSVLVFMFHRVLEGIFWFSKK